MNRVCGNNCYTDINNWYQFGIIFTHSNGKNFYNYLSINNCNNNLNSYCSFTIWYGAINLTNFNSTKNINKWYSGIYIYLPSCLNSNFCTFVDNFVSLYSSLMLCGNYNNNLTYYNIINNNSPNGYGVITNWEGKYFIDNFILLNNSNSLFYVHSGQMIVSNCFVEHNGLSYFNLYSSGTISTLNIVIGITKTYSLIHLNTDLCYGNNQTLNFFYEFTKRKNPNLGFLFIYYFLYF